MNKKLLTALSLFAFGQFLHAPKNIYSLEPTFFDFVIKWILHQTQIKQKRLSIDVAGMQSLKKLENPKGLQIELQQATKTFFFLFNNHQNNPTNIALKEKLLKTIKTIYNTLILLTYAPNYKSNFQQFPLDILNEIASFLENSNHCTTNKQACNTIILNKYIIPDYTSLSPEELEEKLNLFIKERDHNIKTLKTILLNQQPITETTLNNNLPIINHFNQNYIDESNFDTYRHIAILITTMLAIDLFIATLTKELFSIT